MQLKQYTSVLEAQLENHLATANSEHQKYTKEVEGVSVCLLWWDSGGGKGKECKTGLWESKAGKLTYC